MRTNWHTNSVLRVQLCIDGVTNIFIPRHLLKIEMLISYGFFLLYLIQSVILAERWDLNTQIFQGENHIFMRTLCNVHNTNTCTRMWYLSVHVYHFWNYWKNCDIYCWELKLIFIGRIHFGSFHKILTLRTSRISLKGDHCTKNWNITYTDLIKVHIIIRNIFIPLFSKELKWKKCLFLFAV
jgi:hypothetical protein